MLTKELAILDIQAHVTARSLVNPTLTGASIYTLADRAYQVKTNAKIQQQAIALRGKVTYLADLPAPPGAGGEGEQAGRGGRGQGAGQGGQAQAGQQLGPPEGRAWVYWAENVKFE